MVWSRKKGFMVQMNIICQKDGDYVVEVGGNCVITGEHYTVMASMRGIREWMSGKLIQQALPELSPGDREFLISGISPNGWMEMYAEESSTGEEESDSDCDPRTKVPYGDLS